MKKMKANRTARRQSEQVYAHTSPRNIHDLGSTRNHDQIRIKTNFRQLEQDAIQPNQLITYDRYDYDPKTGTGKTVKEPEDVMDHARRSITDAKFRPVTQSFKQRYRQREESGDDHLRTHPCAVPSSPLGGSMGYGSKRDSRNRY